MKSQGLPLKNDITARFVPKMVALMVYLGVLCFIFTLFIVHSASSWKKQLNTHLSVEIPIIAGTTSRTLQTKVLTLLKKTPGIGSVKVVSQKEMTELFHSLLGKDMRVDLLAVPIVIDITLKEQKEINLSGLEARLKALSSHIQLIDHRGWQQNVMSLIHSIVLIALVLTLLIVIATFITTIFATRTSLLIHQHIIEVLSLIGATPSYIAYQFQLSALKQGLIASVLGSLLAFFTFFGIATLLEKADLPFVVHSSFFSQVLYGVALFPLFTTASMIFLVRLVVIKELRS